MNCGLCFSSASTHYLTAGQFRLVKCNSCGLIYVENFRSEEVSYSGNEYFTLTNQYVERWDEFSEIFETLTDKIVRFKSKGRFLDVGAGVGILMSVALRRGFEVHGIEISTWASNFARTEKGLNVETGKLEDANLEKNSYDVVIINHVLEHVENPQALLTEIRRLLKDDGLLVIGVPNIGSFMSKLMGAKWISLRPSEHIWQFTPKSIGELVIKSGFIVRYFESKDNHQPVGYGLKSLFRRIINYISVLSNHSEGMLVFATKRSIT